MSNRPVIALRMLGPVAVLIAGIGCTAARSALQIQEAVDARALALEKDAAERAPYAFGMATYYLQKAWEEAGHGEHRSSVELARKSIEWSDRAVVEVGRGTLQVEEEILHDVEESAPSASPEPVEEHPPAPLDGEDDIVIEGGL